MAGEWELHNRQHLSANEKEVTLRLLPYSGVQASLKFPFTLGGVDLY